VQCTSCDGTIGGEDGEGGQSEGRLVPQLFETECVLWTRTKVNAKCGLSDLWRLRVHRCEYALHSGFLAVRLCVNLHPKNVQNQNANDIRRRSSARRGGESFTQFYTHTQKGDFNPSGCKCNRGSALTRQRRPTPALITQFFAP
jgi:hypothetical protein